jgi:membrane associated rhomboid family serine protease
MHTLHSTTSRIRIAKPGECVLMIAPMQKGCCPRCGRRLEDCQFEGQRVKVCPKCAGLWVRPASWDENKLGAWPKLGAPSDVQPAGRSRLACPNCLATLTTLNIGGPPADDAVTIEIDQCDSCGGIWFDHGEWEQIAALRNLQAEEKALERPTTWGEWSLQFFLGLPIEFNVAPRRFPLVTVGIIAVCVLVYLVELAVGDEAAMTWGFTPKYLFTGFGAVTLFTCMFLHGGILHLLGNIYLFYILGDNVEDALGRGRYLLFYLVCGAVASLAYGLPNLDSATPLVGASGAISGVAAAYVLLYPRARLTFILIFWQFKIPAPVWLGVWFLFQAGAAFFELTGGNQSEVAFLAHVGGFIAGLAIIAPLRAKLIAENPLLNLLHRWHSLKPGQAIGSPRKG